MPREQPGSDAGETRQAVERLVSAASGPAPKGDRPALGYVCSYVPEEIILAAGLHPVRVGARPGPTGLADSYLQSFACSFARALLDGLMAGRENGLAGVVFAYTCDSLRAAFETWKARAPRGFLVHFLNLPARVAAPGVEAYLASEMQRLAAALGAVPGSRPVTAEGLAGAAELVGALRSGLLRLARVRTARPDLLPGSTYLALARAATRLERQEVAVALAGLARELERQASESGGEGGRAPRLRSRPRLLVSGGFLETEEPLRLIEQAGADIVSDDLCLAGRRLAFSPETGCGTAQSRPGAAASTAGASGAAAPSGSSDDPFARLALAYLRRVPCPTKHPPAARFERLLRQVREDGVDGVVLLLQKFCDPHAFDYPALRDDLTTAGVPCLMVEVEQGGVPAGQARTRVEAFVERLGQAAPATVAGGGRR